MKHYKRSKLADIIMNDISLAERMKRKGERKRNAEKNNNNNNGARYNTTSENKGTTRE